MRQVIIYLTNAVTPRISKAISSRGTIIMGNIIQPMPDIIELHNAQKPVSEAANAVPGNRISEETIATINFISLSFKAGLFRNCRFSTVDTDD